MTRRKRPQPLRRKPMRPQAFIVLCGVLAAGLQLLAAWPGWLTTESVGVWRQATTGEFTDAYAPMLGWFWSHAQPAQHGGLGPFLVQLEIFWAGVTMLALGLQPAARWTRFIPLLVLINPATWVILFLSRDSSVLCGLTAAIGVASFAWRPVRRGDLAGARVPLWCAAAIAGLSVLGWPRMLPLALLLVISLCLLIIPRAAGRRARLQIGGKALVIALVAGIVATLSLPAVLLGDAAHTRAAEAGFALDAYRIDCSTYWSTGKRPADPVSPPGLWETALAPCGRGTWATYGDSWTGFEDPTGEQLLTMGDWLGMVAHHPGIVIGGRIQQLAAMLSDSFSGILTVDDRNVVSSPGAAGEGLAADSPNRGGIVLAAYAAVTTFIPKALILWILVIPIGAGWWVRQRRSADRATSWGSVWPVLAWPACCAMVIGVSAASTDSLVIAPAAVLGWLLALWVLGLDSARTLPPRLARVVDLRATRRYATTAGKPRRFATRRRAPVADPVPAADPVPVADPVPAGSLAAFVAEHGAAATDADAELEPTLAGRS